jgi:MFS family permease
MKMTNITHNEIQKDIWESPFFLVVVLALSIFLTGLDAYIFIPALPRIVDDLKTSLDWVSWTMTIFLLFYAATMPLEGKLSDIYGRKRVYIAVITIFIIGSIASSLSWNIYSLIAFRGLQAIGGYFLAEATSKTITINQAFNHTFWFGAAIATIAVGFIVLLILMDFIVPGYRYSPAKATREGLEHSVLQK